jgi:putative chitinase
VTPELLSAATGCTPRNAQLWSAPLTAAMAEFEIDSRYRQAAFLAQVSHESGSFVYVREIWGPTAAQLRYEGRTDLGNTVPGDGYLFRGRGLIQVTGRDNYRAVGAALGLPLLARPELLEDPDNAARSAAWWWKAHGLNELADGQLFTAITQRINGGQNGAQDRIDRYHRALEALG